MAGGNFLEIVTSHSILGKLMLMALNNPGLVMAYEYMLGFTGSDVYIKGWKDVIDVPFGDLMERFPDAVPIGILDSAGQVTLCPPVDRVVAKGDQIIVFAEDWQRISINIETTCI